MLEWHILQNLQMLVRFRIVSHSLDLCAKRPEPLLDPLVAAVDLADVVDHAAALRAQGGDQQRHAGADIRAGQPLRLAVELAGSDHHGAVRVAQHDLGAHGDQPVDEEQPALEHLLVDQHRAARLRGDDQGDADQVGVEAGPGRRVDLGDGVVGVLLDAQLLVFRHEDVVAVVVPAHAELPKADPGHAVLARARPGDPDGAAGHGGQADERGDLHEVRPDRVLAAAEPGDAADREHVGADAFDLGAEPVEEVAQILDMRLGRGVADRGVALGQHGAHHSLLGRGHAHLVEEQVGAAQPVGAQHVLGRRDLDRGAEPAQRHEVRVEPAPADHVAARARQGHVAAARQERLPVLKTYKLFIDGKFPRSESERYYALTSANGESIANVQLGSRKDFRNAVVAARKAFPGWAGRTAYNRGQILYRMAEMLEGRRAQFIEELETLGASRSEAETETAMAVDRLIYYAGWADKFQQVFSSVNPVASSHFNFSMLEPTGVAALLAPEDSGLLGLISVVAPAVAGGNSVVVLASHSKPLAAITFSEVLHTSDLPAGVINILTGTRKELLKHFASHMDVNALVYCGSDAEEIRTVQLEAAENLKRVVIEENSDWQSEERQSPYTILATQEVKTTWHPIGL